MTLGAHYRTRLILLYRHDPSPWALYQVYNSPFPDSMPNLFSEGGESHSVEAWVEIARGICHLRNEHETILDAGYRRDLQRRHLE